MRKQKRHLRPAVLLSLLSRRRGRLERSRQQLGPLAKSAARGGRPPIPLVPVPCFRWRSATAATSEPDTTVAVAAAAAAVAMTIPMTTTHSGMQLVLEHCCDPLIRGSDAGGVRGEGRRFSVWISLLTAGKHGADAAWKVTGFVLRVSSCFLFDLCRERLENRVLETALVSCCSAHENHGGGNMIS